MKKVKKTAAALMLIMAVVCAVGCKKETNNNGGGHYDGNYEIIMAVVTMMATMNMSTLGCLAVRFGQLSMWEQVCLKNTETILHGVKLNLKQITTLTIINTSMAI